MSRTMLMVLTAPLRRFAAAPLSNSRPRSLLIGLFALLAVVACGSKPQPPPGICFAKRARPNQPVEPGEWLRLMLQYQVAPNGDVFATSDCTGNPIHFTPPPDNCIVRTPPLGEPHKVPITEESIMERMLPNEQRLVWIITHRFENGDGFGPVALVRIYKRGLAVDAIGPLRLRRERVGLELWKIGKEQVVMATGETCFDKKDPSTCHRAANVLVYRAHAFLDPQISYRDGRCIDVPWVELSREADLPLPEGWNRHFEITSSLSHDERYLVITEQVEVNDSDPQEPDTPSREVRRIDTDRFIHVEDGKLVTRQNPLWPKVLPTVGETDVTDKSKL